MGWCAKYPRRPRRGTLKRAPTPCADGCVRGTGRQALVREIKEEMGVDATAGVFLGVVENQFRQHGKPHAEINLVYRLTLPEGTAATAQEDWIAFEWRDLADLDAARLLPAEMAQLITAKPQPAQSISVNSCAKLT